MEFDINTAIIKRLSEGDQGAYRIVFEHYYPRVWEFVRRMVKSESLAEDVTQDIFVKIWERREMFGVEVHSFSNYLYVMSRNAAINALRHSDRIAPLAEDGSTTMSILFDAVIPEGLAELTVDITTDSPDFAGAVAVANASHIDLVNPTCDPLIFDVVPFPHGDAILGEKEIKFDLSNAQKAIVAFPGHHVFVMTIVDANGKTKKNVITMVVE
jgi:RNA polymerase sigma factor (sigma-70 family)